MEFSAKVVGQMKIDLQELYALGFRSFAVTNIEPFECFPEATKLNNYTSCNSTTSRTSDFHNKFLSKEIYSLRNALQDAKFNVLDIHNAFLQILQGMYIITRATPIYQFHWANSNKKLEECQCQINDKIKIFEL